ncbi:hypothetical protein FH5_03378 [Priestia endophytica]|nr:hypothetical protein FH5_03378 [Priestia endophytica]
MDKVNLKKIAQFFLIAIAATVFGSFIVLILVRALVGLF